MSEAPDITADRLLKLAPQERAAIRTFLESPLWKKYLSVVATKKPSPFCSAAGSEQRDAFSNERANARLGELRGWHLYEAAIFLALVEPAEVKQMAEETYPAEGVLPLHDKPGLAPSISTT